MGEHNCYKSDAQECIKKKAYGLWEGNGRKPGRDQEYWLSAEKNVNAPIKKRSPKHRA